MKQLILGTTIGVAAGLLLGGTAVYAARQVIDLPYTNVIYNLSNGGDDNNTVSVFDHRDNTCYVAVSFASGYGGSGGDYPAISCVKRGDQ